MIPMMSPNKPIAEPKISMTRILMKVEAFCESAIAAPAPVIPTAMLKVSDQYYPQNRLESPTDIPVQKTE